MAAISWPSGLPTRPSQRRFSEELGSGTDRSNLNGGNPQYRNRSNAAPDEIDCELLLTATQAALLDTFYCETTRGCLRFDWLDSLGTAAECRFVTAPKITLSDGYIYLASFKYEVLR